MNLMMLLEMAAESYGERVAFTNGEDAISYTELFAAAGNAAQQFGSDDSEHLALLDVSSFALPIGLFAGAWSGKPFVPINYRLADSEVDALLERISPAVLIAQEEAASSREGMAGLQCISPENFISAARAGQTRSKDWSMNGDDTAVLLFTSGTTGTPKAAVLRHKHLAAYILGSVEFASAPEDDVTLVCVPPYHIAGVISVLSSVYAGRKVVQMPNFNARRWIELARQERVTTAFLVPTMLRAVLAELESQGDSDLPALRSMAYGGGKMPLPVIERALALLPHVQFVQAYGMTETASTFCMLLPEHHQTAFASGDPAVRRRLTSVGQPLPGVELQLRDTEGNVVGPGERGEIFVRGEQVSGEYVGKGSMLDENGWFPTRDAGELDAEGFLFLEGRADDVIVRGAENMSPGEIEDVLLQHAAIADAAVVGVPDEEWGEAVAAVVTLKAGQEATEEELQVWVKRYLRSSKVPQFVKFAQELPYNETGKLLRRVVRKDLAAASLEPE